MLCMHMSPSDTPSSATYDSCGSQHCQTSVPSTRPGIMREYITTNSTETPKHLQGIFTSQNY